jgi:hypothetical protein
MDHHWPGNLCELERVASDLYWECDTNRETLIEGRHVQANIASFKITPAGEGSDDTNASPILRLVEGILRKHKFVIKPALPELKIHKLVQRPRLKMFLRENRSALSADVAGDSRIMRFMKMPGDTE